MNVRDCLQESAQKHPDKTFLLFRDSRLTFGELLQNINRTANAFLELGVKKNMKAALMLPNGPEFIFSWLALAKLGAVMVPLNTALKGEGLTYIVNHSGSEIVVVHEDYMEQVIPLKPALENIKHWIVAGDPHAFSERALSFEKLLQSASRDEPPHVRVDGGDVLSIIYTSGTTGLPKGVMLPHYSYINTGTFYMEDIIEARQDDIILTSLPLFHCNAQQFTVMGALIAGMTMALLEKFSASTFWDSVRKHNATVFHYIGAILTILYKQPPREDDADNPARIAMGGACPKEIWEDFEKRFKLKVVEGYGLTETGTCCSHNRPNDVRVGSIGKPSRHAQMKVVDENDNDLPAETPGEIVVKETLPDSMMKGYYKEAEKTQETMRGGWFHSGDRGYRDKDGYFYFMDRLKDCIRRRGENISSFEIEKTVNEHPAVLECAAVGVPSELGEDDVKLYVVLKDGEALAPEEIVSFCEARMAYFMVPRYVEFRQSFPKTETQRIQKYELRKEGVGNCWDREKTGYRLRR